MFFSFVLIVVTEDRMLWTRVNAIFDVSLCARCYQKTKTNTFANGIEMVLCRLQTYEVWCVDNMSQTKYDKLVIFLLLLLLLLFYRVCVCAFCFLAYLAALFCWSWSKASHIYFLCLRDWSAVFLLFNFLLFWLYFHVLFLLLCFFRSVSEHVLRVHGE